MTKYIMRRLLQAIPLLLVISLILFWLLQQVSDPLATMGGRVPPRPEDRQRLARQLGLDQPIHMQYIYWLIGNDWTLVDRDGDGTPETPGERRGVLRGDFGESIMVRGKPALDVIMEKLPNTLLLMFTAEIVIIILSLAIGVYSALNQYSLLDNVFTAFSFITFSMPIFWLALMLLYIFSVNLRNMGSPIYFPSIGMYDVVAGPTLQQVAWHMVLPVMTIALISIAGYSRYIRSVMLEVLSSDYIRTARAKGISQNRVLYVHALKNASLPLVTLIGLDLPLLLGGAVVTERIFGWPGMGSTYITHLDRSDFPVLMAILMMISAAVVVFQLLTDIVYTWLDPRIRYS
ncbi:MAG: ABC transporter permease [Chloroflexi bacterium]|nr:ABC transporter permease [Chloroflexota bacterium]